MGMIAVVIGASMGTSSFAQGPVRNWLAEHDQRVADNDSYIQTDGPSFTRANSIVPQFMMQLETRYQYGSTPTVNQFPQFDLRYGVSKRFELRAEWLGVATGPGLRSSQDLELGFKYLTTEQRGWIPQSALMFELFTPTGYGSQSIGHVAPELDYIYGWTLNDKWSVGGSTGAIFGQPPDSGVTQYYQSTIINRSWADGHLIAFGEAYSRFGAPANPGAARPSLDTGLLWRPMHNLQFDWRVGMGLNQQATPFFTSGGASFRY
jgi:hypothetical protein